jgi:hypothetical protein
MSVEVFEARFVDPRIIDEEVREVQVCITQPPRPHTVCACWEVQQIENGRKRLAYRLSLHFAGHVILLEQITLDSFRKSDRIRNV